MSPPSGPTRHDPAATEPLWPTQPILTTEPEEIIADFRTFYYETALSGFETNLVALENFVESDHILFGTDFPAVSPQTAGWYTNNVDTYFQARPDLLTQVMHGNAHSLLPRLATTRAN